MKSIENLNGWICGVDMELTKILQKKMFIYL